MEDFFRILTIIMVCIFPIQIIIALIGNCVSKDEGKRKHFNLYMSGVGIYCILLFLLIVILGLSGAGILLLISFYLGAFILFIYHFLILLGAFSEGRTQST